MKNVNQTYLLIWLVIYGTLLLTGCGSSRGSSVLPNMDSTIIRVPVQPKKNKKAQTTRSKNPFKQRPHLIKSETVTIL